MTHRTATIETTPREAATIRAAIAFSLTVKGSQGAPIRETLEGGNLGTVRARAEALRSETGKGVMIYALATIDGEQRSALAATLTPNGIWKRADVLEGQA